jgi:hypothetical protein
MSRCALLALILGAMLLGGESTARGAERGPDKDGVPSFTRHVEAVFSRLGCNAGACHGAVKGQNGFKLSLFGADPALDQERLLRESGGRRLDLLQPDGSLLLLKATGRALHAGGKRTAAGTSEYQLLRQWIAAGAPADSPERSRVVLLQIRPAEQTARPGESYRLRVEATFADGGVEDVTALCFFEALDQSVATVDNGQVTAHGAGATAILARYRAEPAISLITVPHTANQPFPNIVPHNFIDRHVLDMLRRLNIPPADVADDATFLRRVALDVTGALPAPAEVRAFLCDTDSNKRVKKIDELLQRPGYAALWTLLFCDLLKASDFGVYADGIRQEVDAPRFQQWVRARLDENIPYDQFVERILTATSRDGRDVETWANEVVRMEEGYAPGRKDLDLYRQRRTLDLYWQRGSSSGVDAALQVAHAFLGLRLECAQCHRHPHDVWQQDDLLSFANFFMRVRKIGFQDGSEKKYPEVAVIFKRLNDEAKKLTDDAKKLRDTSYKKLENATKAAKTDAERKAAAADFEKLKHQLAEIDRRSKMLPEAARRLMHSEVRFLDPGTAFATVTSPIGTQTSKRYRLLGQSGAIDVGKDQDPRQVVMAWLRRPENPYFARAIVNRIWAHYFGRGIIDPPDNLSPFNPPSHPELLRELCDGFIKNHYDLKWLHRAILTSRTYQQSSIPGDVNDFDHTHYAYFYLRRLPAEVLVDAINQATGTTEKMNMEYFHWPREMKTIEIPYTPNNPFVTFMLTTFGKPKRNAAVQCDCERDGTASALQVLSFANHPRVWAKIADEKGQVAHIVKEISDDDRRIEEVFLLTLSRLPTDAERQACRKYLQESATPTKGLKGLMWSLLNTREFILQH